MVVRERIDGMKSDSDGDVKASLGVRGRRLELNHFM